MLDITVAKRRLKGTNNLTLVIVKGGKVIFETGSHGIMAFVQAIEKFDKQLVNSTVADKIVGRAAALLCAYSKVAFVFAVTISEEGIKMLKENKIPCQFETRVPNILDHEGVDECPFEKLTASYTSPEEACEALKSFQKISSRCEY